METTRQEKRTDVLFNNAPGSTPVVADDVTLGSRIGERIKQARTSKGMTQQALAQKIGETKPTFSAINVSRWETGLHSVSAESVRLAARALGVSADWLMNGEETPSASSAATDGDITLGARITRAREEKGMRIADVARALETQWQAVQQWEQGKRAPRLQMAGRLAQVLGVTLEELLGLAEAQDPYFAAWHPFIESHPDLSSDELEALQGFAWPHGAPSVASYEVLLTAVRMSRKVSVAS